MIECCPIMWEYNMCWRKVYPTRLVYKLDENYIGFELSLFWQEQLTSIYVGILELLVEFYVEYVVKWKLWKKPKFVRKRHFCSSFILSDCLILGTTGAWFPYLNCFIRCFVLCCLCTVSFFFLFCEKGKTVFYKWHWIGKVLWKYIVFCKVPVMCHLETI